VSFEVIFFPCEKSIVVEEGANLLLTALEAGVHINASCGGEGVCGKCRVIIEEGEVEGGRSEKLSEEEFEKGYRQACLCRVKSDLHVRIPAESTLEASSLNLQIAPRRKARIQEMNLDELKERGLFFPPVEKKYLKIPPPSLEDNVSDVTRVIRELKFNHNEHRLDVDLSVIRKVPRVLREGDFKVTVTLARPVRDENKTRIINVQANDRTSRNYALAFDVGTTTIYGQLIDLLDGNVLAQYGEYNAQLSHGEDVISRIAYAEKPGGLAKMHELVVGTINTIIERLMLRAKIDLEDISSITLAGNTTMTHLLLAIDPSNIRRAPYVPVSTLYPPIRAVDLGLAVGEYVTALVYPVISSYVGGDIVSGVMGSGLYRAEELTLFIDIGTNGEIVVGNKDWMACAACSAGPAFEGGGIQHGMRATKGAIEDFSLDPITLEPMNITIGNVRPKGICGSGLIIIVATLFEAGVIDQRGKFNPDLKSERIRKKDDQYEFVLSRAEETQIGRDLVITEADIDNLIRAKGAMYAGYMTLLEEVGLEITDIQRIMLAGGFGSYIDLERAITIGLLPEIDPEKIIFVGNGSLMGAKMSSLTNRIRKDVSDVVKKMTNFELSETKSFMDHYVASLFLPHTDINLFPRLKKRLEARNETYQHAISI